MDYSYTHHTKPRECHEWVLRGPKGAVHIWARPNDPEWVDEWGDRFIGGVERHSPVPVYDWESQDKPHHQNCSYLGAPCWHDGTSMYFSERIEPMLRGDLTRPGLVEWLNSVLLDFYTSHFGAP